MTSASKRRLRWAQVPAGVRAEIERLAGGQVTAARNCEDGFSPGLASLLRLADGRLVFAKAMDGGAWPGQEEAHRAEIRVAEALSHHVLPVPRFAGSFDDGRWVALVFEAIGDARSPDPASRADTVRVASAIASLALTSAPVTLPADHPRLGGWTSLLTARQAGTQSASPQGASPASPGPAGVPQGPRQAGPFPAAAGQADEREGSRLARLAGYAAPEDRPAAACAAAWAADRLGMLRALERDGLAAARGTSLVHFDAYPHNVLLTPERVIFVDWPHARSGAPCIDLLAYLCSVAAAGSDPEPILAGHPVIAGVAPGEFDAVLAALAGFALCDCLDPAPPGLMPIIEKKISIGLGALGWLARRLGDPLCWPAP